MPSHQNILFVEYLDGPTYAPKDAAQLLGVHPATVRRWILRRKLEVIRPSLRCIRLTSEHLKALQSPPPK
jgi:excisionase family DNA binding protein